MFIFLQTTILRFSPTANKISKIYFYLLLEPNFKVFSIVFGLEYIENWGLQHKLLDNSFLMYYHCVLLQSLNVFRRKLFYWSVTLVMSLNNENNFTLKRDEFYANLNIYIIKDSFDLVS